MSKKHIAFIFLILICRSSKSQDRYLIYEQSFFGFNIPNTIKPTNGISERINFCNGNSGAISYHFFTGPQNFWGIGIGLSNISYQKEFMGVFPTSNEFGVATVNGNIGYWSYPITFGHSAGNHFRSYNHYRGYRNRYRFGFSITYTPSFFRSDRFYASTAGGADRNSFLTYFRSNSRTFQHSLCIGLNDQISLFRNKMAMGVEPFIGISSGYFKETPNTFNFCYGIRLHIGVFAKLPAISIEREAQSPGNADQKKKELEQKQKEIQEQLNKNPK